MWASPEEALSFVGTFDVFWDLFQVLFSGFISGSEGWGVQVRVGFLSMF